MAKTITNVYKSIVSTIQIATSAAGAEPTFTTEIGFTNEAALTVKMTPVTIALADGGLIQQGFDCSVETTSLELLGTSMATLEAFRNTNCWIKVTPTTGAGVSASNPILRVKNFMCNLEVNIDLSGKGVSAVKITGHAYAAIPTDFFTTAAS